MADLLNLSWGSLSGLSRVTATGSYPSLTAILLLHSALENVRTYNHPVPLPMEVRKPEAFELKIHVFVL